MAFKPVILSGALVGRVVEGLLAAALVFLAQPADAQMLERLHVREFTLSSDLKNPRVGDTFKLIITIKVAEQLAEINNLTLPDLSGFDAVGDERRCTATPAGSECTETVLLTPATPGDRTIGSATLDARDANAKDRPSRFATNTLLLHVEPAPAPPAFNGFPATITGLLWSTLRSFLILVALAAGLWFLLWRLTRPRKPKPARAPVPLVDPIPPNARPQPFDFDTEFAALVESLRKEPTRTRAFAVRDALRWWLGAREDETTGDLAARHANDGALPRVDALRAVERAAFCEDPRVEHYVQEALPALATR